MCGSVRLTSYNAGSQGWCEFPRNANFLPSFVRNGVTGAIAEPWNGSSYDGDPGEACGECWEIDTINGGVASIGEKIGVPCPINRAIADMVKGLEYSWTLEEDS